MGAEYCAWLFLVLYIQEYAIMAYSAFLGSYNLMPGVRILFFPTTRYSAKF